MAHTQRNQPRSPGAAPGGARDAEGRRPPGPPAPARGPRKRAPQAEAGKRHE